MNDANPLFTQPKPFYPITAKHDFAPFYLQSRNGILSTFKTIKDNTAVIDTDCLLMSTVSKIISFVSMGMDFVSHSLPMF